MSSEFTIPEIKEYVEKIYNVDGTEVINEYTAYYYFEGSSVQYATKEAAQSDLDNYISTREACLQNATMISFCKTVEEEVGVLYGLYKGINESHGLTINNLQSAVDETTAKYELDEDNLEQVNNNINECITKMNDEMQMINGFETDLNTINGNMKTIGENLTAYHKKVYSDYSYYCTRVGGKRENFYKEAEV